MAGVFLAMTWLALQQAPPSDAPRAADLASAATRLLVAEEIMAFDAHRPRGWQGGLWLGGGLMSIGVGVPVMFFGALLLYPSAFNVGATMLSVGGLHVALGLFTVVYAVIRLVRAAQANGARAAMVRRLDEL